MATTPDTLLALLGCSQSLAEHSRWLPTVLREMARQLGILVPGICGYLVLPAVGEEEREVVDAFGTARALGAAASAELLKLGGSAAWADGVTLPAKAAWRKGFAPGTRFVAAAPIKAGTACLGHIVAGFPDLEAAESALTLMKVLGALAGVHVANAQENEEEVVRRHYLEEHDTLVTDLPNRRLFHDRARTALEAGAAALLFLDLDGFKEVNRGSGYAAGDRVLAEVAHYWQEIVEQDYPRATLARMGGDEFAVLLPGRDGKRVEALAGALLAALREPLELLGVDWVPRASAGISRTPADGGSVEELLRRAEEAMFSAKAAGGDRYALAPQRTPSAGERSTDG